VTINVKADTINLGSIIRSYDEIPIEKLANLSETEHNLTPKNKVVLLPVKPSNMRLNNDCKLWLRSIVYYLTSRLGLKELPIQFALCDDGQVFELTPLSYTRSTNISGDDKSVYILYLESDNPNKTLVSQSVAKLMAGFQIKQNGISVNNFDINLNREDLSIEFKEGTSKTTEYPELIDLINKEYKKSDEISGLEIISFSRVTTNVVPNAIIEYRLTLKNISKIDIFSNSVANSGLYLTTSKPIDSRSIFYAGENYWASFSRIEILQPGDILKSGEQKEFILRFKYVNGVSNFIITNINTEKYFGSDISLDIQNNVIEIPYAINFDERGEVEIISSPVGYINARNLPSLNSEIVGKVFPGKKYPLLGTSGIWYKVEVDGISAWILAEYAKITKNIQ
jgi:hypothetical protein